MYTQAAEVLAVEPFCSVSGDSRVTRFNVQWVLNLKDLDGDMGRVRCVSTRLQRQQSEPYYTQIAYKVRTVE